MRLVLAWFLAGFALAGCRSSLPGYQAQRPAQSKTLESALEYTEDFSGGGSWPVPVDQTRQRVDYQSTLRIVPDQAGLASASQVHAVESTLPERTLDQQAFVTALSKTIQSARGYVDAAHALARDVEAAGKDRSEQRVKQLRTSIQAQGEQGAAVLDVVHELATQEARAKGFEAGDAADEEIGRLTDELYVDAQGAEVVLNVEAFAEFLERNYERFQTLVAKDVAALERAESTRFRLRAMLYRANSSDGVPLHVENYDDIAAGDIVKQPRISLLLTDEEAARLQRDYQVHREMVQLIRDLRDGDSKLRESWRSLTHSIRSEVDKIEWKELGKAQIDALEAAVRTAAESDSKFKPLADVVAELGKIRAKLPALRNLLDGGDLSSALPEFAASIATLKDFFASVARLVANPTDTRQLLEAFAKAAQATLAANVDLDALVKTHLPNTLTRFEELRAALTTDYPELASLLEKIFSARKLSAAMDKVDPSVRAVPLDQAGPGSIDLGTTPADRGDHLLVIAELLEPMGNGEMKAVQTYSKTFEVERLGWSNKTSAHMVLVDRRGGGATTDPDTNFDPFASVSWNLHYRTHHVADNTWTALQHFFDLGAGINVATLDFEDDNVQVGVGVHLSLFDDLLLYGIGYNLSADDDQTYQYIGIGLLELLGVFGGSVNAK